MKEKAKISTRSMVLMALLTAIIVVFSCTPIGSIPIGPLVITLNVIPVAIAAIALGPIGGASMGAVFGLFSILQCVGIGIPSTMGIFTWDISPIATIIQRLVPRVLDGFLVGCIFRIVSRLTDAKISCFITGFFTALLNTIFFMSALVLLFGNNDGFVEKYMTDEDGKTKSAIIYVLTSISLNAVLEMVAATLVAGAVGFALIKAKLITVPVKNSDDSGKKSKKDKKKKDK